MILIDEFQDHQTLIEELRDYKKLSDLYKSEAYRRHLPYLTEIFSNPRFYPSRPARPRLRDFLRVAHWNIEKGKHFDAIVRTFLGHPALRDADVISINEADVGMNRSGHSHVARELGEALGMHVVFAPVYLEFSKGYGEDLQMPGENSIALQGNAILSRYELYNARIIDLPVCFDHFEHPEKRIGRRNAVAAEIEVNGRSLTVVSTHLEVRNTPQCRAQQMKAILEALRDNQAAESAIIAGDLNTNSIARGGLRRTLSASMRLSFGDKERLLEVFANPQSREPLFKLLPQFGFTDRGFNNQATTCIVPMKGFEDRSTVPKFLADVFEYRMGRFNHRLDFRLDWIFGRKVTPLDEAEVSDSRLGIASLSPQSIPHLTNERGGQISDHDPITVDIVV